MQTVDMKMLECYYGEHAHRLLTCYSKIVAGMIQHKKHSLFGLT